MPTVMQQRNLPESIRSVSNLDRIDYFDLLTATIDATDTSPEDWARAAMEDAAGLAGQFVWRVVLGLRLASPTSPERVAGWKIAERGDSWITLVASSWFLTACVVVQVDDRQVSVATLIRYDRPPAALVWPALSIAHRQAMPRLLRHAARQLSNRRGAAT